MAVDTAMPPSLKGQLIPNEKEMWLLPEEGKAVFSRLLDFNFSQVFVSTSRLEHRIGHADNRRKTARRHHSQSPFTSRPTLGLAIAVGHMGR